MFAQLFTKMRSAERRSLATSRFERDLAILDLTNRNNVEEQKAEQIETKLFFDSALLAAAKARQSCVRSFPKALLASFAGMLLFLSPHVTYATEATDDSAGASESTSNSPDAPTVYDQIEGWLERMGLLDEGNADPEDGEG